MIDIVEGFGLGAGKSYFVVTKLIDHFIRGGTAYVTDTMEILWPQLKRHVATKYGFILQDCQYVSFPEDGISRLFEHTPQGSEDCPVLIVVDEAQGKLNARDWGDKSKRELFDWACQSRHDDNDLIFISQSVLNIDKQIRRLATYIWRIRNTQKWGNNVITMFLKVVKFCTFGWHTGAFFVVAQLDQDGKTVVGRKKWLDQDPEIFKCYRSKAMRGKRKRVGAAVQRVKLERRKMSIPWVRWAICLVLLAGGVTGCSKLVSHFRGEEKPKAAAEAVGSTGKTEKPRGPYDIRSEIFRNQFGLSIITTDRWRYVKGTLCPDGMVEKIGRGQILVRQPDGRALYVITDELRSVTAPVQTVQAEVKKPEILIVPDRGLFGPETSPFSHEVVPYSGKAEASPSPSPEPSKVVHRSTVYVPVTSPTGGTAK
jgi:hypothetical protein